MTNELMAKSARQIREDAGLSLRDVQECCRAEGHSLRHSALSMLETGKRRWNADHIDAFCAGVYMPVCEFLRTVAEAAK